MEHRQEKDAIAAAALEYVQNGDTIFLDAGTTTLALARLLKQHVSLSSLAPSRRPSSYRALDMTF